MRWIVALTIVLFATPVAAENLLNNPDFDLDPTVGGNGWSAMGTGSFTWNQASGDPAPPSARTSQTGAESMTLYQCVQIVGGMSYSFSARSFTHSSSGLATNGVSLAVYSTTDCSGTPLETESTDTSSFPNWYLRERMGYMAPSGAHSARIQLFSNANGDANDISWDNVMLEGAVAPVETKSWGLIKARYK